MLVKGKDCSTLVYVRGQCGPFDTYLLCAALVPRGHRVLV